MMSEIDNVNKNTEDEALAANRKENDFLQDFHYTRDIENVNNTISKSTQANLLEYLWEQELKNTEPSKNFWKALAEERRVALSKALSENEKLHKQIDALTEENTQFKDMLDEANSFIEVCKELLEENGDDTGIDVGDMSECNGFVEY